MPSFLSHVYSSPRPSAPRPTTVHDLEVPAQPQPKSRALRAARRLPFLFASSYTSTPASGTPSAPPPAAAPSAPAPSPSKTPAADAGPSALAAVSVPFPAPAWLSAPPPETTTKRAGPLASLTMARGRTPAVGLHRTARKSRAQATVSLDHASATVGGFSASASLSSPPELAVSSEVVSAPATMTSFSITAPALCEAPTPGQPPYPAPAPQAENVPTPNEHQRDGVSALSISSTTTTTITTLSPTPSSPAIVSPHMSSSAPRAHVSLAAHAQHTSIHSNMQQPRRSASRVALRGLLVDVAVGPSGGASGSGIGEETNSVPFPRSSPTSPVAQVRAPLLVPGPTAAVPANTLTQTSSQGVAYTPSTGAAYTHAYTHASVARHADKNVQAHVHGMMEVRVQTSVVVEDEDSDLSRDEQAVEGKEDEEEEDNGTLYLTALSSPVTPVSANAAGSQSKSPTVVQAPGIEQSLSGSSTSSSSSSSSASSASEYAFSGVESDTSVEVTDGEGKSAKHSTGTIISTVNAYESGNGDMAGDSSESDTTDNDRDLERERQRERDIARVLSAFPAPPRFVPPSPISPREMINGHKKAASWSPTSSEGPVASGSGSGSSRWAQGSPVQNTPVIAVPVPVRSSVPSLSAPSAPTPSSSSSTAPPLSTHTHAPALTLDTAAARSTMQSPTPREPISPIAKRTALPLALAFGPIGHARGAQAGGASAVGQVQRRERRGSGVVRRPSALSQTQTQKMRGVQKDIPAPAPVPTSAPAIVPAPVKRVPRRSIVDDREAEEESVLPAVPAGTVATTNVDLVLTTVDALTTKVDGGDDEDEVVLLPVSVSALAVNTPAAAAEKTSDKGKEKEREAAAECAAPTEMLPIPDAIPTTGAVTATATVLTRTRIAQSVALAEVAEGVADDAHAGVDNYAVPPPPYTLSPPALAAPVLAVDVASTHRDVDLVRDMRDLAIGSDEQECVEAQTQTVPQVLTQNPSQNPSRGDEMVQEYTQREVTVVAPTPRRAQSGVPAIEVPQTAAPAKEKKEDVWEAGDRDTPTPGMTEGGHATEEVQYPAEKVLCPTKDNNRGYNPSDFVIRGETGCEYNGVVYPSPKHACVARAKHIMSLAPPVDPEYAARYITYKFDSCGQRYAILPRRARLPPAQLRILHDLFRTVVTGLERRNRAEQAMQAAAAAASRPSSALSSTSDGALSRTNTPEPTAWWSPHGSRAGSPAPFGASRRGDIAFGRVPLVEDEVEPLQDASAGATADLPERFADDDDRIVLAPPPPPPPVPSPSGSPPPQMRVAAERAMARFFAEQAALAAEHERARAEAQERAKLAEQARYARRRARVQLDVQDAILAIRLRRRLLGQGVTEAELEVVIDDEDDNGAEGETEGDEARGDLELPEGVELEDDEDEEAMAACEAEMQREREARRAAAVLAVAASPMPTPGKAASTTSLSVSAPADDDDEILLTHSRSAADAPTKEMNAQEFTTPPTTTTTTTTTKETLPAPIPTRTRKTSGSPRPTHKSSSAPMSTPPPSPPPPPAYTISSMVAFLTFNHRYAHSGRRHGSSQRSKCRSPLATVAWMGDGVSGVLDEDAEDEEVWDCESVVEWYAGGMD